MQGGVTGLCHVTCQLPGHCHVTGLAATMTVFIGGATHGGAVKDVSFKKVFKEG